jgi:hypothetical protein
MVYVYAQKGYNVCFCPRERRTTMSDSAITPASVPDKSLVARFVGVIVSPREVFEVVAAHPSWLMMAIVVVVLTAAPTLWFQSTDVGRQATLDESVRQVQAFGVTVSDQMYEAMRKSIMEPSAIRMAGSVVAMIAMPLVMWALIAGLAMGIVGVLMGGSGTFKKAFSAVVHSSVIGVIGVLVVTPLNYARESLTSATNLGVLMPFLPDGSFLARLFGMMDLFRLWWLFVLAIGFGMVFKKKTGTMATLLFGIYAVIAIGFAAFMAARS